ncbi:hypothetical protein EVJ58_g5432 [Rhodofomes roseus]|uniref:PARP catalytic domain-containing protein n=1 Tax=Rhodofomes roseus TaxID=34475 RepID=A0A4Y9YCP8_9APHY|nr:hypothetical protein EVJ58_g5432 [Rhodofomes roseus]
MGVDVSRIVETAVLVAELKARGDAEESILQANIHGLKPVCTSTPILKELERGTKEFTAVMYHFANQWRHPTRVPTVLRTSFSIARVGQHHKFSRFGKRIYTTGTSSKANDYVVEQGGSPYKAMLLSEVVAGKEARKTANDLMLSKPPDECDCVLGVPGTQSVLNYDEVVVYRDDAIRPSFLVIYQSG